MKGDSGVDCVSVSGWRDGKDHRGGPVEWYGHTMDNTALSAWQSYQ